MSINTTSSSSGDSDSLIDGNKTPTQDSFEDLPLAPTTLKRTATYSSLSGLVSRSPRIAAAAQTGYAPFVVEHSLGTRAASRSPAPYITDMTATSPARGGVSPGSSPRLPSPPPITEVQIGPRSPGVGDTNLEHQLGEAARIQDDSTRRIRPGTKAADMAAGPPLIPLNEINSAFQLQEHIKALYAKYTHDPHTRRTMPITKETALLLAQPPQLNGPEDVSTSIDRNLWLYELCRFLVQKANNLVIAFFEDSPACSQNTCPEMRASEWQYLCAVHDPPKSCCAIDYCCHTLDWASNVLTSTKYFSSRLHMGGDGQNAATSIRHLTNIFRRVYRIFAHAWFQHRAIFWEVEGKDGLYMFFKTVCDAYQLIPEDNYTIPPEAEGGTEDDELETPVSMTSPEIGGHKFQILTKNGGEQKQTSQGSGTGETQQPEQEGGTTTTVSVGATTRRHKHTPSTGSAVTMIREEGDEDEEHRGGIELRDVNDEDKELSSTAGIDEAYAAPTEQVRTAHQGLLTEGSLGRNGLGKLDLGAESMSGIMAPEDPTPLAIPHDDPMASLATASAMYGYGEEGEKEIEEKMAAIDIKDKGEQERIEATDEGEPDEGVESATEEAPKADDGTDLNELSKKIVHDSQEINTGEAEREKKVNESAEIAGA